MAWGLVTAIGRVPTIMIQDDYSRLNLHLEFSTEC